MFEAVRGRYRLQLEAQLAVVSGGYRQGTCGEYVRDMQKLQHVDPRVSVLLDAVGVEQAPIKGVLHYRVIK